MPSVRAGGAAESPCAVDLSGGGWDSARTAHTPPCRKRNLQCNARVSHSFPPLLSCAVCVVCVRSALLLPLLPTVPRHCCCCCSAFPLRCGVLPVSLPHVRHVDAASSAVSFPAAARMGKDKAHVNLVVIGHVDSGQSLRPAATAECCALWNALLPLLRRVCAEVSFAVADGVHVIVVCGILTLCS
jgi:hypothetical protein